MRPSLAAALIALAGVSGCAHRSLGPAESRVKVYAYHAGPESLSTSAYYAVGPRGIVVFDAPLAPQDVLSLSQEIRINSARPVTGVVVTSAMPERYAGTGQLVSLTGAELWASRSTTEAIRVEGPAAVRELQASFDVQVPMVTLVPDHELETGERAALSGIAMEAIAAGAGPAPGMTAIYLPDVETLIAGGLVFNGVHPRLSGGRLDVWIASLEELSKLDLERVLPGSGAVGGPELIQTSLLYLRTLEGEVAAEEPFEEALSPEVKGRIRGKMEDAYPGWELTEALSLSIRDEWLRQGGFPADFASTEGPGDDADELMLEGEPAPGETDLEILPPLFGLEAPDEAVPDPAGSSR